MGRVVSAMQALRRAVTCPECDTRDIESWILYDYPNGNLVWGIQYECNDCAYQWRTM